MRSRLFENLRLGRGRQRVQARGPLEWEDGDVAATVAVIIHQDDGRIAAAGGSRRTFTPGQTEWEIEVDARDTRFESGPAGGKVIAVVARSEGPAQELEWRGELELVAHDR